MFYFAPILQQAVKEYSKAVKINTEQGYTDIGYFSGTDRLRTVSTASMRSDSLHRLRTDIYGGGVLDVVGSPEDALNCLQSISEDENELPYDVILTIFGEDRSSEGQHWCYQILQGMRKFSVHRL